MGNNNLSKEDVATMETLLNKLGVGENKRVVKKNTGLLERNSKDKVVLTEDNRQILTD